VRPFINNKVEFLGKFDVKWKDFYDENNKLIATDNYKIDSSKNIK
jgi:hypothetical protein